jgi:ubiquinone/menaquinone biosynthesis C-methylase UbiE
MTPRDRAPNEDHAAEAPRILTPEYYARMRELEASSWWNEGMRDVAAMLLRKAALPAHGKMLDAGCGSGQTMRWFAQSHRGWTTVGFDLAMEGLEAARAERLPVCQATALEIPVADRSVDVVISLDVLQHLPLEGGDTAALAEFFRVLRTRGILLVRTNAQSFPRAAEDKEASFRKYDRKLLRRRLEHAGFQIIAIGKCNAVLGVAEIPRELMAGRTQKGEYHGILAQPRRDSGIAHAVKRRWLGLEGRAVAHGLSLPLGRTLFALCRTLER